MHFFQRESVFKFISSDDNLKKNQFKSEFPHHVSFPYFIQKQLWQTARYIIFFFLTAKSLQSCPTLCDPTDGSPPGSPVPGILQARTLEWVAISFSNACKWKVKVKSLSRVWLLATPWTAAPRLLHPWDFPRKSAGVGCHCLNYASLKQVLILIFFFSNLEGKRNKDLKISTFHLENQKNTLNQLSVGLNLRIMN